MPTDYKAINLINKRSGEITDLLIRKLNIEKEYLCHEFIKETGCKASEITICQQMKDGINKIWIEKL